MPTIFPGNSLCCSQERCAWSCESVSIKGAVCRGRVQEKSRSKIVFMDSLDERKGLTVERLFILKNNWFYGRDRLRIAR